MFKITLKYASQTDITRNRLLEKLAILLHLFGISTITLYICSRNLFVTMPPKFFNYILAVQYLEQLLGCPVDMIQDHKNLRSFFREQIEQDGIDIFTR